MYLGWSWVSHSYCFSSFKKSLILPLPSIEDSMFQFNSIVLLSSIEVLIEIYLRTCRDEIRDLLSSCFQFEFEDHCSFAMSWCISWTHQIFGFHRPVCDRLLTTRACHCFRHPETEDENNHEDWNNLETEDWKNPDDEKYPEIED